MTLLGDHIEVSWTTLAVALVDLSLVAVFVLAGELRHYTMSLALSRTPGTYLPFAVGWLLAAPVIGAYARKARENVRSGVARTAFAWGVAVAVGQSLRATSAFHGDFDPSFALVSLLVGWVLLLPWRAALTRTGARD